MSRIRPDVSSIFRSIGQSSVPDAANEPVQFHRLLALLGVGCAVLFGYLQGTSLEGAVPTWPSVLVGGLFTGLLGVSFVSRRIRRHSVKATQGLLYLLMGWLAAASALSGYAEAAAATLLFASVVFPPLVGVGARSVQPAVWLWGFGLSATAVGGLLAPASGGVPLFLLGCMTAAGLVEGLAAKLMAEPRMTEDDGTPFNLGGPFPSITENAPAALFRTAPGEGIVYANRAFAQLFGYESADAILQVTPNALFANSEKREQLWETARSKGGFNGAEVTLKRKDQSTFTGLLSTKVAYGDDGGVTCCDGIVTDISDRKRREQARREAMTRLARAAESQDYGADGHLRRVGTLARLLAEALGRPPAWQARIEEAAAFHDVGKICVADRILEKPGSLTEKEREAMKKHASTGPDLLSGEESELVQMARRIARSHHERWDGNGYPDGLKGNDIPLSARIVAVADAFDAMTHERPYREAFSTEEAFSVLEAEAGAQFDPKVSEAALHCRTAMAEVVAGDANRTDPSADSLETLSSAQVPSSLSRAHAH